MWYGAASLWVLAFRGAEVIIQARKDYSGAGGSMLMCYHREITQQRECANQHSSTILTSLTLFDDMCSSLEEKK